MPKKLPLPDYSDTHFVWGNSVTRDIVEELAAQFRFKPEYDLYRELNEAASWLEMFHPGSRAQREKAAREERKGIKGYRAGLGDAAPRVRRREFEVLQARGKDFLESLRKLGHHARVDLAMNDPKVPQGSVDPRKLGLDVQVLLWATRNASDALHDAKPGRPPQDVEVLFAACIRKIYREGTGNDDKPKHDRDSDTYGGDFFDFFVECMKAVKLYKSDRQYYRLARDACNGENTKTGPKTGE